MVKKKQKSKVAKVIVWILFLACLFFLGWGLFKFGYAYGLSEGRAISYDEILLNVRQWDEGFEYQGVYFNPSEYEDLQILDSNGNILELNKTSWTANWRPLLNKTSELKEINQTN